MEKTTFLFEGIKDYQIAFQFWKPETNFDSVIVLVHGLGEHSGRYSTHFADFYTNRGYAILTFDLPGHGKSGGKRGLLKEFDHFFEILDFSLQYLHENMSSKSIFLYGHSMGGLITLDYSIMKRPEVTALIITSPPLDVDQPLPLSKVLMAKVLNNIIPSTRIKTGLITDILSKDPAVVQAYIDDPLVHDLASARLGMYIIERGAFVRENPRKLKIPTLLMVGTSEANVSQEAIHQFGLASQYCQEKTWPGLFHEIHNEPEHKQVFEFTENWIRSKIVKKY